MSGVAIYLEGGGDTSSTKAALRQGMGAFLNEIKEAARKRKLKWKLVPCGGRNKAFDAFMDAVKAQRYDVVGLLVDAEGPVRGNSIQHLIEHDGIATDFAKMRIRIDEVNASAVHLMIQTMETWIVADPASLQSFYGQELNANQLPNSSDLEAVSKQDISRQLDNATRPTSKGRYHKIRHASELLKKIRPTEVRKRCPSCERLFDEFIDLIDNV